MDGVDLQIFPQARLAETFERTSRDLPEPAPLAMPTQSLSGTPSAAAKPATSPVRIDQRRAVVVGGTAVATGAAAWISGQALMVDGLGVLDIGIWAVSAVLFAWTGFSFFIVLAGFVTKAQGHHLGLDPSQPAPRLCRRTAILAPVFNEESHRTFGRLQAICESVQATGQGGRFDLFILSDSTDPAIQADERAAFQQLRRRCRGQTQVYYRLRRGNRDRKAGNIAEWVTRFGAAYSFMVILDADSLMTGDTLVRLAGAMERNPGVGLLQTVPMIVNRDSLFGRTQQFAGRLYGPLLARGLAWWSGAEGNYWGHNAIIRVDAFAAHAGLPQLSGPKPFGGAIMSHDFVEAALIRRAGYAVHMAPDLGGSYEECPPTLAALMKRDSRWCQGNLQHLRVLRGSGLHWINRLHLFSGALAYGTAPLWFALLCMGALAPLLPQLSRGPWATSAAETGGLTAVGGVFAVSMLFLLAPKALAYASAMSDRLLRRAFGGRRVALQGVLAETLISALIAPIVMLGQARSLMQIIRGRDGGWSAQDRDEDGVGVAEAARCHRGQTLTGLLIGALAFSGSPGALLWLSPALIGLVVAIPLAMAIARSDLGQTARRHGLLVIPEEIRPPEVITRANRLADDYRFHVRPTPWLRIATRSVGLGRASARPDTSPGLLADLAS